MSSPPPITSHSAPKTKENNNTGQQKRPQKPSQIAVIYISLHNVCDWSYTTQKMCIKLDFHIHALNNNLS